MDLPPQQCRKSDAIRVAFGTSNPTFAMARDIRSDLSERTEHDFDGRSYHYVYLRDNLPVGSMTVQSAVDTKLDCEAYFPELLRQRYQSQLISTCKLRIRPGHQPAMLALRTLVRAGWKHQLGLGARISVINVADPMRRFYQRIGFSEIPGYEFTHPVLETHSHVMVMAVDPSRRSFCKDLFEQATSPRSQADLVNECVQSYFAQSRISEPLMTASAA